MIVARGACLGERNWRSYFPCDQPAGYDGADERIAPSFDICDVSIAGIGPSRSALRMAADVDPEAPLSYGYVDQPWSMSSRFAMTSRGSGKIDQNIQRPLPMGSTRPSARSTLSPNQKPKGRTSASCERRCHACVSQQMLSLPARHAYRRSGKRRNCAWG